MNTHEAVAVREQGTFVALPYEDVFCTRCLVLMGAFVGRARCWKCGTVTVVLTGPRAQS